MSGLFRYGYVHHVTTAGSLGGQSWCDREPAIQTTLVATGNGHHVGNGAHGNPHVEVWSLGRNNDCFVSTGPSCMYSMMREDLSLTGHGRTHMEFADIVGWGGGGLPQLGNDLLLVETFQP